MAREARDLLARIKAPPRVSSAEPRRLVSTATIITPGSASLPHPLADKAKKFGSDSYRTLQVARHEVMTDLAML